MPCTMPFLKLYWENGYALTCCGLHLQGHRTPVVDGSTPVDPWSDVWNHPEIVSLREKVLAGDYSACQNCPVFRSGRHELQQLSPDMQPVMKRGPRLLYISDSLACNLHCWICRYQVIAKDQPAQARAWIFLRIIEEFASDVHLVSLLHSGEVLVSPQHMEWLQTFDFGAFPNLRLEIITNATLLRRRWSDLANAHSAIDFLNVSIDGATKETYEDVRRGGKWEAMIEGVDLIEELLRLRRIKGAKTNFVVTARNCHEMAQFAELMTARGFTQVMFNPLAKTSMTDDHYRLENVCDPAHPKHHVVREQLAHTIMQHPAVDLRNIRPFVQPLGV